MTVATIYYGARVWLKSIQGIGQPGIVVNQKRGRVTVHWPDMGYMSRHKAEALEAADDIENAAGQKGAA